MSSTWPRPPLRNKATLSRPVVEETILIRTDAASQPPLRSSATSPQLVVGISEVCRTHLAAGKRCVRPTALPAEENCSAKSTRIAASRGPCGLARQLVEEVIDPGGRLALRRSRRDAAELQGARSRNDCDAALRFICLLSSSGLDFARLGILFALCPSSS